MDRPHPEPGALVRLAAGELSGTALAAVLTHLSGCAPCGARFGAAALARAAAPAGGAVPARTYEEAVRRAVSRAAGPARRVRQERRATEPGLTFLLQLPARERSDTVRASPMLRSYTLARECLARSRQAWFDDPARGDELAALSLHVAGHLSSRTYGSAVLEDLRAEAWCHLANARRIRSDHAGAADAFGWAEEHRRAGTGDPAELAAYSGLYSTYLRERDDLEGARAHLDQTIALHRRAGSRHLEARALLSLSILERRGGKFDLAMSLLHRAAGGLDPGREPRLTRAIAKNRILFLADRGARPDVTRALAALDPGQELTRLDRLRTLWARGVVLAKLEQPDRAESALLAAQRGFVRARIPQDVALLDLDLARLYLGTGRRDEARARATTALPTFAARGLQRDLLDALDLFRRAGGLAASS
ncbi:MAG TPA: hypothetical protein VLF66_13875 [Thermoanaerobaculia bacterium]|nr:hypothetical protein [Thermoanaerobaculia bacterium]